MSDRRTCPVVGLVGGVGSGKSTLARRMAVRFDAAVIDGDAAGHRALADADVQAKLRDRFGMDIFTADGTVDRSRLAGVVFGSTAEHAAAKADLERITHPVIRRELGERIAQARDAGAPVVLLDAAVLLEAGWRDHCNAVIFVDAPDHVRLSRVVARGWSEAEWRRREASQLSLAEKRQQSDAVIENTGLPDEAVQALAEAVERVCGIRLSRSTAAVPA